MLAEEIKKFFKGEVLSDEETLKNYSHDASIFSVRPKLVVYPQDSEDLQKLTKWIKENREQDPTLSLAMRSAGSCMSGGSLNESIIADVTKHMNHIGEIDQNGTEIQPGVFYRDFEPKTLEKGLILPCYTASKQLAALGGMIGNNCAGEKTLRYGKMENYVLSAKYIFSDGHEYEVKPLNKHELEQKMAHDSFEGKIYKRVFDLVTRHQKLLQEAKPKVTKNSAGYYLWNVWDGETFNLNKLLTGAQGTLGAMTEAKLGLVKDKTHHDLIALFFNSWDALPQVVNALLPFAPESLETFDKDTLKLGIKFMPEIAKKAHSSFLKFLLQFWPETLIGIKMMGLPKLIVLVEVAEDSEEEVKKKVQLMLKAIEGLKVWHRVVERDSEEEKFWVMRRESFNLLRQHVHGKRTVPLVDDFCIPAERVPEFLPKAKKILEEYDIDVNIAGHAGNGNFHIIPLMDLTKESERGKLIPVAQKFYELVAQYEGTTTGEHNDGIVRTPFLGTMYKPEVLELFRRTKQIFDPQNIFNPGKKVPTMNATQPGTLQFFESHIAAQ